MPVISGTKYRVDATWDDAPHLTEEQKAALLDSIPPHQRDARTKGIPQLGAGAIYPIEEERLLVEPFKIPEYWPVAYALDVGWKATAALWGAWDFQSDTVYLWSEYKQGLAEPPVHADAIKSRGDWIPGVIDPAARGRNQKDGTKLLAEYTDLGLNLQFADNAVEAGLFAVYRRMVSGRLKIFNNLIGTREELRLYRRDEHGKVVKDNDHFMDDMRYLIMSGLHYAIDKLRYQESNYRKHGKFEQGRNKTTGY